MNIKEYAKSLGIEIPGDKPLDVEAGKAGYNQYLADIEQAKATMQAVADKQKEKSWWDKVSDIILGANQMSSNMSDNPAVSGFNAAVEAYKNMPEDNKPSDDWTDEERWTFGEKYAQNKESAYEYAKQLNIKHTENKKLEQKEKIANATNQNAVTRALGSAASLALNAGWGYAGYLDALAQKAAGRDTIQQDILMPHEVAETMQGSVAGHLNDKYGTLNENIPVLGGKGFGDVYGLGMSWAQSRLALSTGGSSGALVQFFGMAASQGVTDAISRGADANQALAFGTISGLAEAIPEMISVDKVLGIKSAEGVQNLFKNILSQAGQEFGEELTTSLINQIADDWIMGGHSKYYEMVNELIASGMSAEEAKKKALTLTIEGLAYDALQGFLSGAISGGIATAENRVNQQFFQKEANETAKKALSPEASKLIEEAKKYDSTKKRAEALEKKVAEGKELTGYELRMLVSQLTEASRNADVDTVRKAIVEKMKSEGVSDSMAKTLGEIALNKAIGNEVSKVQDLMLKRNENALKVYNQISEEMMESGLGDSEWARNTPIQRLRAEKRANEQPDTEQRVHSGIERLKADIAAKYGKDTREYKINMASIEGKFGEVDDKIVYKTSENSKLHVDGISSSLTQEDMIELAAIEKIANELGVDIHVYETKVDNKTGERVYTDKDGKRYSDNGFYDPSDNSIHIDLRAGENGEGTMLYTASHELVHFMKKNAPEHYAALEELVTKELVKGGFSIDQLVEEQRKKDRNGLTDEELREEVVAEACQKFLASKSAVAEIKALKTKNKGLWTSLKKFFTSLFNKINKVYKTVPPDSAEGKYIADMRKSVKPIRDVFFEGAVASSKKSKTNTIKKTTEKMVKSKARVTSEQDTAYLDAVKRGDMETAQKLVDEAAKANGYTVKGYHATNAEFNVFDISKTSDINYHGRGIYFTNSKRDVENNYENYEGPDPWQKIEAAAYELLYDKYNLSYEDTLTSDSEIIDKLNECYDEVIDKFKKTLRRVTAYLKFDNPLIIGKGERASDYDLSKYDGIIDKHVYENIGHGGMDENTVHYVVLNPSNIKSADPVTYDDNGKVIHLSERFNDKSNDIRHKARYTEYNKPITAEDITTLRSIGRKSINSFTAGEIEKAQKWAYKFYQELGAKSPFFRAWFGDWRAYQDAEAVKVATIPVYVATNEARKENRGLIKNDDTKWDIRISREGETNTISHSGEDRLSEYGLAGIKGLLTNAVLLDSEVHEHHKNNAKNDLISFDHKLYALGMDNKKSVALYKITVEEFYQSKNEPGNKKFHNLRYIQKIADNVGGRTSENSRSGGSTNDISAKYSISNLFNLVKQYDKEFKPKAVNPLLLNDDGTPKVFYHGTRSQFTEFILQDKPKFGRALGDGFYFTPNYSKAHQFANGLFSKGEDRGGIVMPVYLRMSNPFVIEESTDRTKWRNEYHNGNYDGIIDLKNQTWYVEESTQIKSATDNIGTFDSAERDIRHKSRTSATAPYVSPTATSIVTNIDSGYDYTGKDKFMSGVIATQIAFTNAQAGIESIAKKYGVKNIESLVQAARAASHQAEEMISGNQYRIGSDTKTYLGEGLQKIFSPIEEKGEEVTQAFFDYLFHYHNADRMSLEQRSIEWNEKKKKEHQNMMKRFAELQKEQTNLYKEKAALTRKKSDSARRQEINQRLAEIKREISSVTKLIKKTQAEIDSFVPLKNKAVIGLNRAEIIAKKEELSKQIDDLIAQKKSLGRSKKNAAEVTEISLKIGELIAERDSLSAEVTADKSREIIAEYEKNYDYFREVAEKIWQYNRNLNQYRVDTGLINQEQYDYLEKLYPHYVPSYRADVSTGIAAVKGKNNLAISQSIKQATGSTKDLLNPIVIMARQTMETVRAGRINQIAEALYNGAGQDKTYLAEISRNKVKKSEVVDIDPTELRPKANQVTFFKNGERIVLQVSSEIFAGFDAFAPAFDIKNPLVRFVAGGTDLFKKLVTSANPVFLIRNAVRDLQDAGINTKYAKSFMNNYKEAIKQISENGELWKLYKAMGGSNASYFDFDKGFLAEQNKRGFSKKIEDTDAGKLKSAWQTAQRFTQMMENANSFVEALPRLAEFISSIQAGNTAEQAMLDAADVTTNFARTGKITRALNSTVIPFLNPAIQGASKAVRNVASVRSMREAAILAAKATLLGIAPFLLNALLYSDDEDYEDLRDTDKENNYLIKIGDAFVKIPRGRMASVLAGATNRSVKEIFTDEKVDWGDYLKNVSTQMNPLENMARTIFSPFLDVANNVTWYGSAIEGREFENKAPAERFDESTSSIAVAIGKVLNYSPKKIHYLLDQYSGVIGDFILPATTKKAERDFLSGNFTIDPVTANRLSDDFYDMYYDAQYAKSADPNDKIAEYQVKHLNRVKSSISELFKAKDEIQNSNLSDREKRAETKAIQILINEAYKTALTDFELITNAIKATSRVDDKYRYAEVLRLVYGSETALKEYDEKVYAKSTILNEAGLSYDVFYKYYFSTRDITSDKDNKGNTITGSKKQKTIEAINKINTTEEKRLMLIAISGYSFDEEKDKQKLLKYVNSLKVSSKTKLALADLLGFEYKNGKIYP